MSQRNTKVVLLVGNRIAEITYVTAQRADELYTNGTVGLREVRGEWCYVAQRAGRGGEGNSTTSTTEKPNAHFHLHL